MFPFITAYHTTTNGARKDAHKETGNKIAKNGNAARLLPLIHPAETVTQSPEKIRPRGTYLIPIAAPANIPANIPARFSATSLAGDRHAVCLTSVRGGGLCGGPLAALRRDFNRPPYPGNNFGNDAGNPTATAPVPRNCRPHQGMLQCQRHNTCVTYRHPINRD